MFQFSFVVLSQERQFDTCEEIGRIDIDYFIEIDSVKYKDNDEIYLCNNQPTVGIRVLYNIPNDPRHLDTVSGIHWNWTKSNCLNPSSTNALNSVNRNTVGKKIKISFTENYIPALKNKKINLLLKTKKIETIKTDSKTKYGYAHDTNNFSDYPYFDQGTPYQLSVNGRLDSIKLKLKNSTKKSSIPINGLPTNDINFRLSSQKHLVLGDAHGLVFEEDSINCIYCTNKTLLKVDNFVGEKDVNLHIFVVRELDDDLINYCPTDPALKKDCSTPIQSDTFQCILPGNDNLFDLGLDFKQPWIDRTNDSIVGFRGFRMKVMAGKDSTCQSNTYRSTVLLGDTLKNAANFNYADLIKDTKEIYARVGINIIPTRYDVHANFDLVKEDNKIEKAEFNLASARIKLDYLTHFERTETVVLIFPDIVEPQGKTKKGFAVGGSGDLALDGNLMSPSTLSHELGHAIWNLHHPDDSLSINDGINNIVMTDNLNLMTSGGNRTINIPNHKIALRRYVWKRMRK